MYDKISYMIKKKHDFLEKGIIAEGVSSAVLDNWTECQKSGIAIYKDKYPDSILYKDALINQAKDFEYMQNISQRFKERSAFCEVLKVASLRITNYNGKNIVYYTCGCKDLLEDLESKNIRVFTSFSTEDIGPNAVSDCLSNPHGVFVNIGEAYQDFLADYVFFASEVPRSLSYRRHEVLVTLHVCHAVNYNKTVEQYFKYSCENNNTFLSSQIDTLPQIYIKDSAFNSTLDDQGSGYIILDMEQRCIDLNNNFAQMINKDMLQIRGHKLIDIFPELCSLIPSTLSKGSIQNSPVIASLSDGTLLNVYVDTILTYHDNEPLGITFYIRPASYIQGLVNDVTNSSAHYSFDNLIGENADYIRLKKMAMRVAKRNSTILITGESGTGKELFAQSIHNASQRYTEPFIALNCGSIPKELIGSELFGYDPGAFTGAKKTGAMGKFEQANGGTIFLDEIAEMSIDMQVNLLRVLEESKVTRLGGVKERNIDVRVIAATNRDLEECIEDGTFREDLYYRLNVINLNMINLRDRIDDIPIITGSIINNLNQTMGLNVLGFSHEAMRCLMSHNWPGNIRELRNLIERCMNLEQDEMISYDTLPNKLKSSYELKLSHEKLEDFIDESDTTKNVSHNFEQNESERIKKLMIQFNGNKSLVAKELGMSRVTLYKKLERITEW